MDTRETLSKDPLARLAERQDWISPQAERSLQALVAETVHRVGGNKLRHALHGDWLHEPLHVIMTDVPVGSWTATVAFDAVAALSSGETSASMDKAADATLVLGLLGAVGAAITGMNDWSEIEAPAPRKIGLIHAVLNIAATGLFAGSGLARLREARGTGRSLAALGYLLVSLSAHLGGNLIYEHGIGVMKPGAESITEAMRS